MREIHHKKTRKTLVTKLLGWTIILILLYCGWAVCWPKVMRYVTAHKSRNIQTELYNDKFADMNPAQLEAAKRYGITPIDNRNFDFEGCQQLTEIKSCKVFCIDKLTHSVPFLTPAAASLLREIGEEFQMRTVEAGLGKHRVIVTSVLRTKDDVLRLATVNVNASENSAHCYGTTFDLSYYRFQTCGWVSWDVYDDRLVEILAEVLVEKRKEGQCYVRFEKLQHCFRITSRR